MKTVSNLVRIGCFVIVPVFALELPAQVSNSTSTYTTRRGDQVNVTRSGEPGSRTVDRTVTTPDGKSYSTDTTQTRSRGNYSRDTTITGPNGKTKTYQNNATWGNGTYNDTRSFTGHNGRTRTLATTRSGREVTKTLTGGNGHTRSWSYRAGRR